MSKVRIYQLARELQQYANVIINDARDLGADVKAPSNSIDNEVAEKIRQKYTNRHKRQIFPSIIPIKTIKPRLVKPAWKLTDVQPSTGNVEKTSPVVIETLALETCQTCGVKVRSDRVQKHHRKVHNVNLSSQINPIPPEIIQGNSLKKCPYCDQQRTHGKIFAYHLANDHPNIKIKCIPCGMIMRAGEYLAHQVKCFSKQYVKCEQCDEIVEGENFDLHCQWHQRNKNAKRNNQVRPSTWQSVLVARNQNNGKRQFCRHCGRLPIPGCDLCYACQISIK